MLSNPFRALILRLRIRKTPKSTLINVNGTIDNEKMVAKPTVAIFGASGHLGTHIVQAFMESSTRENLGDVILFTRDSSNMSPELKHWQESGNAIIRSIAKRTSDLSDQLVGVDIVVNAIGSAGDELREKVVRAVAGTNVKLYFPSEFGVDHTIHDFSHPEWDKKKEHLNLAQKFFQNTQICSVYAGLFTEDSIGPWFGFDTRIGQYECYGSSQQKVSFTSLDDVGRAVACLASLPLNQVPIQVHISGSTVSVAKIANEMKNKSGSEVRFIERPLQTSRRKELSKKRPDPSGCLRFLMGEGKIKHTADALGCDNELVNPGESKWRWKTMSDLADETGGRPWADATWS